MSHGLFSKDGGSGDPLYVTTSRGGGRNVSGDSYNNGRGRGRGSYYPRGGGGGGRGRGRARGGTYRGGGSRGGGGGGGGVHPLSRYQDDEEEDDGYSDQGYGTRGYRSRGGRGGKPRHHPYDDDRRESRGPGRGSSIKDRLGPRGGGGYHDDGSGGRGGGGPRGGSGARGGWFSNPRGGGGGRGRGGGFGGGGPRVGDGWNKVTMPNASGVNKDVLLASLSQAAGVALNPMQYHCLGDKAMFFVNNKQAALKLVALNNKVNVEGLGRLVILVRASDAPRGAGGAGGGGSYTPSDVMAMDDDVHMAGGAAGGAGAFQLDERTTTILMDSLGQRYDPSSQLLDLSDFYHDQVLAQNNMKGILRPAMLGAILSLIEQHCSQLVSLDLSNNGLRHLEGLRNLHTAAPHLSSLSLGDNQLRHSNELEKISQCVNVQHLILANNPFVGHFRGDASAYATDVRARFKSLKTLDGQPMPEKMKFGVDCKVTLPEVKGSYLADGSKQEMLLQFLKNFFQTYDTDRQKLVDIYADEAYFSLQVGSAYQRSGNSLQPYVAHSRNFVRVKDMGKRVTQLRYRRLQVVTLLMDLPATKHLLESFTVDLLLATASCLAFSVSGVFEESVSQQTTMRAFTRTFLLVPSPSGDGVRIGNDALQIRNPSPAQLQNPAAAPVQASAQAVATAAAATGVVTGVVPLSGVAAAGPAVISPTPISPQQQQRQQMVIKFSEQSGMNSQWSERCLAENNWNYEAAGGVFTQLMASKQIPADAFVK